CHADPLDRCARAALRWRRWLLLRTRHGMGSATLRRRTARSRADRRAAPLADRQHGRAHDVPLNRCPSPRGVTPHARARKNVCALVPRVNMPMRMGMALVVGGAGPLLSAKK